MKDKCLQNAPNKILREHLEYVRLYWPCLQIKTGQSCHWETERIARYTQLSSNKMLKNFGKCNLNSTHTKYSEIRRGHSIMEGFVWPHAIAIWKAQDGKLQFLGNAHHISKVPTARNIEILAGGLESGDELSFQNLRLKSSDTENSGDSYSDESPSQEPSSSFIRAALLWLL
jgi:hypothetical protein